MYSGMGATVSGGFVTTATGQKFDLASCGAQVELLGVEARNQGAMYAHAKTGLLIGIPVALVIGWFIGRKS